MGRDKYTDGNSLVSSWATLWEDQTKINHFQEALNSNDFGRKKIKQLLEHYAGSDQAMNQLLITLESFASLMENNKLTENDHNSVVQLFNDLNVAVVNMEALPSNEANQSALSYTHKFIQSNVSQLEDLSKDNQVKELVLNWYHESQSNLKMR